MAGKLGEILIRRGLLTNDQLQAALHDQGVSNALLGAILVGKGWITTEQLGRVLSEQFDAPFVELAPQSVNPQLVRLLPETFARERQVVPVQIRQRRLTLAMLTPDDIETISEAELITGYEVDPVIAMQAEIQATLDHSFDERLVARQTAVDMKLVELEQAGPAAALIADSKSPASNKEEDAPVVRLTKAVLMGAINAKASDIHIEPHNPEMRVRYRIDGELQQVMTIPKGTEEAIIARLKVLANLDTTENRRPQDGRITVETDGKRVNFRTSCIPTTRGEKICMRLLDEGAKTFDIDTLGLTSRDRGRIQGMLDKPHGMIVVTGPTGSGKTTTMYAMLSKLNTIDLNITTVEDPVEYKLTGINQVQSDNDFGLGFANALKYILRQDPDVIMVGEIRDHETATTAVQAALTGHMLISTLHTNDAVGAVPRLNDLGIDWFKIGGSLIGAVAQRLLRGICPFCRDVATPSAALLEAIGKRHTLPEDAVFYQGRGCKKCFNSGYYGRIPIFEVLAVTPRMSEAIERGMPATHLREIALEDGMVELPHAAFEQAVLGRTTLQEVYYKT